MGLWRKVYHCCFALAGRYFQFTVSCMAVLRAWTFASAILGSSALLLPLHRLHRRYLLRSCALLSGSDCCRFWQAQHYIPEALNSQCLFHTLKDTVNKKLDASLDFADKAVVYLNFLFLCAIFHFDRIMDYYLFNQRV